MFRGFWRFNSLTVTITQTNSYTRNEMHKTQYHLLHTKRFLPLFLTQFLTAFNDNVCKNAFVILLTYKIAQNSQSTELMVAMTAGVFILPFFLFSAMAGQLADKYEKSFLIKIIKTLEILLMVIATLGFYWSSSPILMATIFLLGTHSTFFGPIKYSILPDHLHKNELIGGNALIEAGTFLAILIGQILGGTVILLTNGVTFIAITLLTIATLGLMASLFIPKTHIGQPSLVISPNILKETKQIMAIIREKKDIYLSIMGISWFWFVGATLLTQFPPFIKNTLHSSASVFTLYLTTFSLGIGIGSLFCNRLLKGKITAKYVPMAIILMALFTLDIYFATRHISISTTTKLLTLKEYFSSIGNVRILIDILLLTVSGGLFIVPLYAIIQDRSDESKRSRVIAGNNIFNALFMVLSSILVILATKLHLATPQTFLLLAICNLFVAGYICQLLSDNVVRSLVKIILKLVYRLRIYDLHNYPSTENGLIIVANHTSFLDAILLGHSLPGKLTFAVNTQIASRWWLRSISKLIDLVPIDPTKPLGLKTLIKIVRNGGHLVIFPEGRITVTGSLMKIYEGPGVIADLTQASVLPIRIEGAQYTPFSKLKNKVRINWFPRITLTILPAKKIHIMGNIKGRARRQQIAHELYDVMSTMMFTSSFRHKTLFESLLDARRIHSPNHMILEDSKREPLSYKRLIRLAFLLGTYWSRTLTSKQNVGLLLPNSCAAIINFFALQSINRTPTMLNYTFNRSEFLSACQMTGVKEIITSKQFITQAKLEKIVQELLSQQILLYFLEDIQDKLDFRTKLSGLLKFFLPSLYSKHWKIDPSHQAVILFTSGSEGTPKGVVLSHNNIQANRYQLSARIDFSAQDVIFNPLPIFHSFGLNSGTLLPIFFGIKTFLYPSPLHYRIIPEYIYDLNATILVGTDTFLQKYARYANPYDFYSLRYVLAGAERLKDETQAIWVQKFGLRILEGYGATETSPVLSINTPMHFKPHTVGRFLPGINYRLEPISGIEDGGKLMVQGPNIMLGYICTDQPGVTIPPLDYWYDTGDIICLDDEGYITILGRAKRFAKIAGEMVSLTAIEQFISSIWPNDQHAVLTRPDALKGEQLVLVTTCQIADRETLRVEAKKHGITEIRIPKQIIHINHMPLLGTGKIDYKAL